MVSLSSFACQQWKNTNNMIRIKIETDCREYMYIITKSNTHRIIHCIRVSYVIQDL